ncbi:MAG: hypothetical protein R3362_03620, partial [Rhodothermales bacterium]|nr:hypothetical protein [Rhodothermales bacterium]
DHNLYVKGRYVYASNYKAGLRILDANNLPGGVSEPLTTAGFFDTYPASDGVGFGGGTWSNYPFFESGVVIVSDMDGGLFVLEPTLPGTTDADDAAPDDALAGLSAPAPNPFATRTALDLAVDTPQRVTVAAYDLLGRRVATLYDGQATPGEARRLVLEAGRLPAGTYVVHAAGETFSETRRVTLVR